MLYALVVLLPRHAQSLFMLVFHGLNLIPEAIFSIVPHVNKLFPHFFYKQIFLIFKLFFNVKRITL